MISPYEGGKYRVTQPYTGPNYNNGQHQGIDLVGLSSKNLLSLVDGKVTVSQEGGSGALATYGNWVEIKSNDGKTILRYAHLSSRSVSVNQIVKIGTIIGVEGSTGYSTGSHCHFEVHNSSGTCTDPAIFLGIQNKTGVYNAGNTQSYTIAGSNITYQEGEIKFSNPEILQNATTIFSALMQLLNNPIGVCAIMGNMYRESAFNPKLVEYGYGYPKTVWPNVRNPQLGQNYTNRINECMAGTNTWTCYGYTFPDSFFRDRGTLNKQGRRTTGCGYGLTQWTYWSRKKSLYEFVRANNASDIGDINIQLRYLCEKELPESYPALVEYLKTATDLAEATHKFHIEYERSSSIESVIRIKYAYECYSYLQAVGFGSYTTIGGNYFAYIVQNDSLVLTKNTNYCIKFNDKDKNGIVTKWYGFNLVTDLVPGDTIVFDFYSKPPTYHINDGVSISLELIASNVEDVPENYTEVVPNGNYSSSIETSFIGNLTNNAIQYQLRTIHYPNKKYLPAWFLPCFEQLSSAKIIDEKNLAFSRSEMRNLVWLWNSLIYHGRLKNNLNKKFNYID